jgi:hypothetical protein
VAAALSWTVLHAEGRVTPSNRSAVTRTIYEFATQTVDIRTVASPTDAPARTAAKNPAALTVDGAGISLLNL